MAARIGRLGRGYFVNRSDLILRGLVIVDVALEGISYELFHAASQCILCVPADASGFHSGYNFCWCAATFSAPLSAAITGWRSPHLRSPNGSARSSRSEAASV